MVQWESWRSDERREDRGNLLMQETGSLTSDKSGAHMASATFLLNHSRPKAGDEVRCGGKRRFSCSTSSRAQVCQPGSV